MAIESAEIGVYKANFLNSTLEGDKRFYQLFGVEHQASWNELTTLMHPDDKLVRRSAYKLALNTGKLLYETRVFYKDDSVRWLKITGKIFYNEQKRPITLLGVVEDITKQKNLEEQKDHFISLASHELKTPVTTLKAYAQILQTIFTSATNDKAADMLFKMDKQINKLTELIVDMLDITKIDKGEIVFKMEEFAFIELVEEIAEEAKKTSNTHKIKVKLNGCQKITGDRKRIGQVITNLVSNAIKFSPNASEIIVTADCDHKSVKLSVQDFGIGIAEPSFDHIFRRFSRVSGNNKGYAFSGLGLGLYMSSEIIKRHDGVINFESRIGGGSTFSFELPLLKP